MNKGSITLVSEQGPTNIYIQVEIKDDGDVLFSGQDTGEAPRKHFGSSDYEYWVRIPAAEKDKLTQALIEFLGEGFREKVPPEPSEPTVEAKDERLMALIEAVFRGDQTTTSHVMQLATAKGFAYKFDSYP